MEGNKCKILSCKDDGGGVEGERGDGLDKRIHDNKILHLRYI